MPSPNNEANRHAEVMERFDEQFLGCDQCVSPKHCSRHQFKEDKEGRLPEAFMSFLAAELDAQAKRLRGAMEAVPKDTSYSGYVVLRREMLAAFDNEAGL